MIKGRRPGVVAATPSAMSEVGVTSLLTSRVGQPDVELRERGFVIFTGMDSLALALSAATLMLRVVSMGTGDLSLAATTRTLSC